MYDLFTSDKSVLLIVMATALLTASFGTCSVVTGEVGFPVEAGPSVVGMISDTKIKYCLHNKASSNTTKQSKSLRDI